MKTSLKIKLIVSCLVINQSAIAANEDFLGSFSGTETLSFSECTDPNDNGTITGPYASTNFNLVGNNYSFRGAGVTGVVFTGTGTITGALTSSTVGVCENGLCSFTGNSVTSADLSGFTVTTSGQSVAPSGVGACTFSSVVTASINSNIIDPENTASTTVTTTPTTILGEIASISSDIGGRVQNAVSGLGNRRSKITSDGAMYEQTLGFAAGETVIPFGVWASFSYAHFENDFSASDYAGDRKNILAGIDYSPWLNSILGIALGYEFTDLDTTFNRGEAESEGFTIAPYFGAIINDIWSVDASFGYSLIETEQFRRLVGSTTPISSDLDTDRWFGTANINGNRQIGNWLVGGRLGLLIARSIQDDFRESDGTRVTERTIELNNWNISGNVSYLYNSFEPFAIVTYNNEFSSTTQEFISAQRPEVDDDDVLTTIGIRYFSDNGFTGNLEYTKRLFRRDFEEDILNFTIRGEF